MIHTQLTDNEKAIIDSEVLRATAENIYYGAKDAFLHLGQGAITGFNMEILVMRRDICRFLESLDGVPTHGKHLDKWKLKELFSAMKRDLYHFMSQTEDRRYLEDSKKIRTIAPTLLRIQGWMTMVLRAASQDKECRRLRFLSDDWTSNPALASFLPIEKRERGRPRSLLPPKRKKRIT